MITNKNLPIILYILWCIITIIDFNNHTHNDICIDDCGHVLNAILFGCVTSIILGFAIIGMIMGEIEFKFNIVPQGLFNRLKNRRKIQKQIDDLLMQMSTCEDEDNLDFLIKKKKQLEKLI